LSPINETHINRTAANQARFPITRRYGNRLSNGVLKFVSYETANYNTTKSTSVHSAQLLYCIS